MNDESISVSVSNAEYLTHYINKIIKPAGEEFTDLLQCNNLKLHHAYSFNFILAHAVDHILFSIVPKAPTRTAFIMSFDEKYEVEGCEHINNKFQLLDAINNSLKHVSLDPARYKKLIDMYGDIDSRSLYERNGKVYIKTEHYTFDYGRVVLRPIYQIFNCGLSDIHDVIEFINGRVFGSFGYGEFLYDYEPYDAIDRMIDHCNPVCMDCGELADECECTSFVYKNQKGDFNPDQDSNFDFEDVMSQISGTREWQKKE